MKKRLIALFTLSRSIDQTKDRGGKYSLNKVSQFAKLGPVAKPVAPKAVAPATPVKEVKADAQPSLFGDLDAHQEMTLVKVEEQASVKAVAAVVVEETKGTKMTKAVENAGAMKPKSNNGGKFRAATNATLTFVASPAVMLWRKLHGPKPNVRPRAQAELALAKVTVLRNDLSDADVMVVAKERKELKPAEPPSPTGTNTWTKATARWIKLKDAAEGETRAEAPAARPPELAETPP